MNKGDFWYWLRGVLIVALIITLVVVLLAGLFRAIDILGQKACERLGNQIGYNTNHFSSSCHIEIRPNLWVRELDIAEFLPLIDCEKDF